MKVHSAFGPGLLESAYEACLLFELHRDGLRTEAQVELPIVYDTVKINAGYRIDLLVEDTVVLELKSVEKVLPIHHAQLLSYLKLSGKPIGLLINFNEVHLKDGLKRMAYLRLLHDFHLRVLRVLRAPRGEKTFLDFTTDDSIITRFVSRAKATMIRTV